MSGRQLSWLQGSEQEITSTLSLAFCNGIEDAGLKAINGGGDIIGEAKGIVLEEWGEVEGEGEAFDAVGVVGLEEGGVCGLAGDDGFGVIFPAGDLGIETGVELVG